MTDVVLSLQEALLACCFTLTLFLPSSHSQNVILSLSLSHTHSHSHSHTPWGINSSANCAECLVEGLCLCEWRRRKWPPISSTLKMWPPFPLFYRTIPLAAPSKGCARVCVCVHGVHIFVGEYVCAHKLEGLAQRGPIKTSAGSKGPMGAGRQSTSPPSTW